MEIRFKKTASGLSERKLDMDSLFTCEFAITKDLYLAWAKENNLYAKRKAVTAMWCVITLLVIGISIWARFPYFLIFALYTLYRAFFRWRILTAAQYKKLSETYGRSDWTRCIYFENEHIRVAEACLSVEYDYPNIEKIEENNGYIKLHFANGTVIRLYADKFTQGTWDECKAFLSGKI